MERFGPYGEMVATFRIHTIRDGLPQQTYLSITEPARQSRPLRLPPLMNSSSKLAAATSSTQYTRLNTPPYPRYERPAQLFGSGPPRQPFRGSRPSASQLPTGAHLIPYVSHYQPVPIGYSWLVPGGHGTASPTRGVISAT
jgi:hypothetical protein